MPDVGRESAARDMRRKKLVLPSDFSGRVMMSTFAFRSESQHLSRHRDGIRKGALCPVRPDYSSRASEGLRQPRFASRYVLTSPVMRLFSGSARPQS